jgi:serine/threonine-protein kinase
MSTDEHLMELLSRWEDGQERGQTPTPQELCRDRPELLPQLVRHIHALQKLKPVGGSTGVGSLRRCVQAEVGEAGFPLPDGPASTCPPRYQELRLHARGGLGEVHVAWDEELRREVALKRIHKGRAGSATSRQRFLREAEITALLEHPGVVPIHGLVQDADGQPCYAMRFVQGETLQDAIERFHAADQPSRDPGERSLALRQLLNRFVTVCNTIAYAHSRNIIHRDLKPGNIMLGQYGETLVVDWGLAKAFKQEETSPADTADEAKPGSDENEAGTQTGQTMGTPGYMSPEQAAGCWDEVGPASDIYSLGATLKTIVTGHAPSGGVLEPDRIRRGEFRAPHGRKKKIPRALAAVCLRALALRPQDRYASALDLAADVEHWLADEPLEAYPEQWPERLQRWGRRHRAVVAATGALLLTAILALTISTLLIRQREQAAQTAREQAESQRLRANANLRLAREAVDRTVTKITADSRLKRSDFHQLRHDLLESMVPIYEQLVRQRENDPELQAEQARAYGWLGVIRADMGEIERSLSDLDHMVALYAQLAADFPMVPGYRVELATGHNDRGVLLRDLGRHGAAEAALRDALKIREQLATDFPQIPDYRCDLAASHNNLGNLLRELGKSGPAEAALRDALKIREQLVADFPMVADYRMYVATSHNNLGTLLTALGKHGEAEAAYRKTLEILEELTAGFPTVTKYRARLAGIYSNLAGALSNLCKHSAAEALYRKGLQIREQLAADFPKVPGYRQDLAMSHYNLGHNLAELGKHGAAETAYCDSLKISEQLVEEFPAVPDYQHGLAITLRNLSVLAIGDAKFPQARQFLERAITHHQAALKLAPEYRPYQQFLRKSYIDLAHVLARLGERTAAAASAQGIAVLGVDPATGCYGAACALSRCILPVEEHSELATAEHAEQAPAYSDRAPQIAPPGHRQRPRACGENQEGQEP